MNRDLLFVLIVGLLFWSGVYIYHQTGDFGPIENCFVSEDQFLICKIKE